MPQDWELTGPQVLEVGGEGEPVQRLTVEVFGGRVDVLTHEDSSAARIEVVDVQRLPLHVLWDGSHLQLRQERRGWSFFDRAKAMFDAIERNQAVVSISIPANAIAEVRTVSASALLTGLRNDAKASTVSGLVALDDIVGATEVNTVSGDVEIERVRGTLSVNSVSASVTARQCDLPEVRINTVSGDIAIEMTNAAATLASNSVSGDVTVRSPHAGYDIDANSASGQVVIDGQSLGLGSRGQHSRLSEGSGDLRLKANAVSGNITILRASERVEATVAP